MPGNTEQPAQPHQQPCGQYTGTSPYHLQMQGTEDRQATSPGRGRLRAPLGRVRPSAGLRRPPWKLLPVGSRSHAELPQAWRPRPRPGQAERHARGVTAARARRPACRAGGPGGPARTGRRERGGRPGVAPGDGGRQGSGPQPCQGHARAWEGAAGAGGGRGGVQLSRSRPECGRATTSSARLAGLGVTCSSALLFTLFLGDAGTIVNLV